MVDGKPRRSEYRHFRVKGVEGADDFASVREVVLRRFRGLAERGEELPDLLMIDGGKGQLAQRRGGLAAAVPFADQPVVGLAKRLEELFLPRRRRTASCCRGPRPSLRLLQVLRDEAHRFALAYHRKLRGKRTLTSALDGIPGIGPKRRTALLQRFGSVQRIADAEIDQIAEVRGFSLKLARDLKCNLKGAAGTLAEAGRGTGMTKPGAAIASGVPPPFEKILEQFLDRQPLSPRHQGRRTRRDLQRYLAGLHCWGVTDLQSITEELLSRTLRRLVDAGVQSRHGCPQPQQHSRISSLSPARGGVPVRSDGSARGAGSRNAGHRRC